jgi:drug/metabolite transporter (DMT)-like permease
MRQGAGKVAEAAEVTAAAAASLQPSSSPGTSWALAAGLAIVCVWGANFAVQKALFEVLPPAGLLFARYLLMPLCAALLLMCSPGARKPLPRADLLQIAFLGFLGHSVHVTMVTFGIHWSTAFSSALILACGPIFTLLILHWVGHERLSWPQVAGVGIACVGVLVFLSDKLLGQQWAATGGDLMMLLAAALFSYYTVMSKPLIQRHGGVTVMAYATIAGSPPVVLFCASSAWVAPWAAMGWLHWGLLLWATLVSAFLGWLVWGWVNERRGVARTAPLQYLMPVVAGIVAWWATGERFSTVKLGGAVLTLGGVALAQFADRLRRRG